MKCSGVVDAAAVPARKYLGAIGAVAPGQDLDMERLAVWLRNLWPDLRAPLKVRQFAGGMSNLTYLLETAERRFVLRRRPPGKLLKSAHAVDREFRVMTALAAAGIPVPQPLAFCSDDGVVGTMFY
ncbi:MAG: phosphotransferase, partial [Gammaproteobacteria bacterium]|nr:phosphotransferase [Gammaproteobacteria bacterium]